MAVPWPRKLYKRRGSPQRLAGLTVYYDFRWRDRFPDRRTQFRNGQSLARLIRAECPEGKTPALLLTLDALADEAPILTDDEYIAVVRLDEYLNEATGDPATSYYARNLDRITDTSHFRRIADSPEILGDFLDEHLSVELISSWAGRNERRLDQLRAIQSAPSQGPNVSELLEALKGVGQLDGGVWNALVDLLPPLMDNDARQAMVSAITRDQPGRLVVSSAIASRILERMEDARTAAEQYSQLLSVSSTTETDLQQFIQDHPWMIGLDYVAVRPRFAIPRGQLDFILERYDGFHDVLELKSPQDPIIMSSEVGRASSPPSPSRYALSAALAGALAQVHAYRETLTTHDRTLEEAYGLPRSRNPRMVIVIGRTSSLTDSGKRVLEQLNLSLSRVEIMPYDIVGERARGWLSNLQHYLSIRTDDLSP
jgi:hypothetical protein